jgi:lipopolysaccharide/colanic/teichoic acid biosynthesis glycosyltransferase
MKRAFDLLISGLALVMLLPVFALIAAAVAVFDGRPVFFRHERIGLRGKPFGMWKFRTMVRDASQRGMPLTVRGDTRITPLGHWLRKTKLDELPQLWNVFIGEMSLVGPRPEVLRYVSLYTPAQARVLQLMPGITDAASIAYRNETDVLADFDEPEQAYIQKIVPEKIRLNLEYARDANVLRDCVVIFKTLGKLCWRR